MRLSIHKANCDLESFRQAHPEDPSTYQGADKQTYTDLLQAKARVALDLAIAGNHCGARFMGDAMSVYHNLYGANSLDGNLEEEIIELLAKKRYNIAQQHIQTFSEATHTPMQNTWQS